MKINMSETNKKYVSWFVFIWVVAIFTTMLGVIWFTQIALMNNISQMRADIGIMKTDISWIAKELNVDLVKK